MSLTAGIGTRAVGRQTASCRLHDNRTNPSILPPRPARPRQHQRRLFQRRRSAGVKRTPDNLGESSAPAGVRWEKREEARWCLSSTAGRKDEKERKKETPKRKKPCASNCEAGHTAVTLQLDIDFFNLGFYTTVSCNLHPPTGGAANRGRKWNQCRVSCAGCYFISMSATDVAVNLIYERGGRHTKAETVRRQRGRRLRPAAVSLLL